MVPGLEESIKDRGWEEMAGLVCDMLRLFRALCNAGQAKILVDPERNKFR